MPLSQHNTFEAEVRRRLALNSNPTVLEILKWSLEIEIPEHRVWKIVYELTRDELMAQAKLQNEVDVLLLYACL